MGRSGQGLCANAFKPCRVLELEVRTNFSRPSARDGEFLDLNEGPSLPGISSSPGEDGSGVEIVDRFLFGVQSRGREKPALRSPAVFGAVLHGAKEEQPTNNTADSGVLGAGGSRELGSNSQKLLPGSPGDGFPGRPMDGGSVVRNS